MFPFKIKSLNRWMTGDAGVGVNVYFYTFIERKYITVAWSWIAARCSPDDESHTLQKIMTDLASIYYKCSTLHGDTWRESRQPAHTWCSSSRVRCSDWREIHFQYLRVKLAKCYSFLQCNNTCNNNIQSSNKLNSIKTIFAFTVEVKGDHLASCVSPQHRASLW